MAANLYSTLAWRTVRARALQRDGSRCSVSRLLGGRCSDEPLHVHHIVPVEDGGGDPLDLDNLLTVCSIHHPQVESIRRAIVEKRRYFGPPRCPHHHRSSEGRRICEARMSRRMEHAA